MIAEHVLLSRAGSIAEAGARLRDRVTADAARRVGRAGAGRLVRRRRSAGCLRRLPDPPAGLGRIQRGGGACPRRTPLTGRRVPYQYVILRVVPSVERGERINAGVVLFCRQRGFLGVRWALDGERLAALGCAGAGAVAPSSTATCDALARVAEGDAARRADRGARPVRPLRLAGGAVEHGRPAVGGAHRAVRGPAADARGAVRAAGPGTLRIRL